MLRKRIRGLDVPLWARNRALHHLANEKLSDQLRCQLTQVVDGYIGRCDEAAARAGSGAAITDDGVSLTIATRDAGPALAGLAGAKALAGLRVQGATLEDVFLSLTGREYRA